MNEFSQLYTVYSVPFLHFLYHLIAPVGIVAVISVIFFIARLSHMYQDEKAARAEQSSLMKEQNRSINALQIADAQKTETFKYFTTTLDSMSKILTKVEVYITKHTGMHDKIEEMGIKIMNLTTKLEDSEKEIALLRSRKKKST